MDLIEAIVRNDIIALMHILQNGVDPNEFHNEVNLAPLHFAVQNNSLDAVILLITAGADPKLKTDDELTALDIARNNNNEKMINLLLKLCHMRQKYLL